MMERLKKKEALDYHERDRKGKIEVVPTKPYSSQRDLSLAYSPGVAEPCKKIAENVEDVYKYTTKGNLVAVISNGTAVLGLGDIGPEASKPVMEGKGLLFKIFADIDVFDIEVDAKEVDRFIDTVKAISPTFGGINLEDIKAPEAFEIEKRLKTELNIPIMHDDQHGTAIISAAALINALELAEKNIQDIRIVVSGAGAAAISCVKLYLSMGARIENIFMFDSKGLICKSRTDLDQYKAQFAEHSENIILKQALHGADVFLGLSKGGLLSKDMVKGMAKNPIVFALANPEPEITWNDAVSTRPDVIMATGRSDYPNQVNNVLGFPYIFRGALDVRATSINEEMKIAAVKALAELAKQPVPEEVTEAYNLKSLTFGREFIIPKPLDARLITTVAPAVAKAAIESGVAKATITDWEEYEEHLKKRMGLDNKMMQGILNKAKQNPKRVVFAEADHHKILKAAQIAKEEGFAEPILLGNRTEILNIAEEYEIDIDNMEIIDPKSDEEELRRCQFADLLFEKRKRRGFTLYEARKAMRERNYFGLALVETGYADTLISGLTRNYPDTIRPALRMIGKDKGVNRLAGMYIMFTKNGPLFLADTTINYNPTAEELADITALTARTVEKFRTKPNIALLSYSNFGSSRSPEAQKVADAVQIIHQKYPKLVVDGELQANFALSGELLKEIFPFSELVNKKVNTLIFPNLEAGNIAYKLIQAMNPEIDTVGPILLGMKKPIHVLQLGSSIREIVNMVAIAVVDSISRK